MTSGLPEDTAFPAQGQVAANIEGNGQWDCASYWRINHTNTTGSSPPTSITMPDGSTVTGTCGTPATTTFSRYQIYRYEIGQGTTANNTGGVANNSGAVGDWSGNFEPGVAPNCGGSGNCWSTAAQTDAQGTSANSGGKQQTESGYPYCAAASSVSGVDISTGGLDRRNIIVPFINCLAQAELGNLTGGNTAQNVPVAAFGKWFITQPYTALNDGNLYGEVTGLLTNKDGVIITPLAQLYR